MPASSTILHKRNSISGVVPSTNSLSAGEIAINTADGKMFTKTTDNIVRTFLNSSQLPYTLDTSLSSSNYQYGANAVTGILAGVLGGINNSVSGAGSTVINGSDNNIEGDYAFIGNGSNNTILSGGDFGAILGGQNNTLNHQDSFILGSNITSHLSGYTYVNNLSATGTIEAGTGSSFSFYVGNSVVGINTTNPAEALSVNGNAEILGGPTNGLILTAPNGSRWKLTVTNTGSLSTVAV